MQSPNKRRTVRNLTIFAAMVVACGWLGVGLDRLMQSSPDQQIGMLLWLITPLCTLLLLRAFAGDGWKDFGIKPNFKGNGIWYSFSLFFYPALVMLILFFDRILGWARLPDVSSSAIVLFLQAFVVALAPAFIKNIFEEFAWRGYLTPKVHSFKLNGYVGYIIVGLIWWAWHLPYWLVFDPALIQGYTSLSPAVFISLALVELIVLAILFGEIRLLTNSVWPTLLMHTVYNVFVATLFSQGLMKVASGIEFLALPGPGGLLPLLIMLLVGIGLHQWRTRKERASMPIVPVVAEN